MTLVELMLTVAMTAILVLVTARAFEKTVKHVRSAMVRDQLLNQARITLETITAVLKKGRANTVVISTPSSSAPPSSQIQFQWADGTSYRIYWQSHSIYLQMGATPPGRKLCDNATSLLFMGDTTDPAGLLITFRLELAVDPRMPVTAGYANQTVHMLEG